MVQRKVANKLGIQADHVKSDKLLGNLKPSPSQHQDGKNRGTDMKKKMKKSRSIKLSDLEGLRSTPSKRNISQPGKPPTLQVPAPAATPQKQQPIIRTIDGSPNYMKPTTSSDARKELSLVSLRNTQTGSDCKRRKFSSTSKVSPASSKKPAKTLTRKSSLKLVRTLTKTPSFKLTRCYAKKSSRVALCADIKSQKATCSSTLKDSKFPAYLTLNSGGTESEGTSAMKVCPYTYCSLNGHHHIPLPPLKGFLSARRRLLRIQKNLKLEALSPRRVKPLSNIFKDSDIKQDVIDVKPAYVEADSNDSTMSLKEKGMDFFIEIYANKEDKAESTGAWPQGDDKQHNYSAGELEEQNSVKSTIGWDSMVAERQNDFNQGAASMSDGSPTSEIDLQEHFLQDHDYIATEAETKGSFLEEPTVEYPYDDYPPLWSHGEKPPVRFCHESSFEGVRYDITEMDDSEAIDMEWEEGQFSASDLYNKADSSISTEEELNLDVESLSEVINTDSHDEFDIWSDDIIGSCSNNILVDEVLHEAPAEDSACLEEQSEATDSDVEGINQSKDVHESGQVSYSFSYDQFFSSKDVFQELTTAEEDGKKDDTDMKSSVASSNPIVEQRASSEENREKNEKLGNDDTICTIEALDAALYSGQEQKYLEEDSTPTWPGDQISDTSQGYYEINRFERDEACSRSQELKNAEAYRDVVTDDPGLEQDVPNGNAGHKMEMESHTNANVLVDFNFSLSRDSFEAVNFDNRVSQKMGDPCHVDDTIEDSNEHQEANDETTSQVSDMHCESTSLRQDQAFWETDQGKAKQSQSSSCTDEEENRNLKTSSPAGQDTVEVGKVEVEDYPKSDEPETSLMLNNITDTKLESTFFPAIVNANQKEHDMCKFWKGAIRSKRLIEDDEELRKFNPREPNYLPLVPDPDGEKVDLRHQMIDERKNAEEWMVDYALQQTVTKLAPARKRKVALLVEAFEKVMPIPKYETQIRNTPALAHTRPMQACS
ncbi:Plant calmodulin-binding protein-related, putative isoform 1 [Quillaja saponaria]|uniref:Plant calmodulin-binding protein-related, putative isoform 1 n=1 Tax=Quillaja saponaria TaxID=32244 RepID=A0AAD7L0D9_QUISA|nr:Plant calmodulin-binding protein-related, putative isoform 1 [Quillaja saponaria]